MTNVFTLEDLDTALEEKYGPFHFKAGRDTYVLRQVLRLPKTERDSVLTKLKELEDAKEPSEESLFEIMNFILATATEGGKGDKLIALLGGDLLKTQLLLEKWMEATQPGEAESSPS